MNINWSKLAEKMTAASGVECAPTPRGVRGFVDNEAETVSVEALVRYGRLKLRVGVGRAEAVLYFARTSTVREDIAAMIETARSLDGRS